MTTNTAAAASSVQFYPFSPQRSTFHFQPKTNEELRWNCTSCKTSNNISLGSCRRCGELNATNAITPRVFLGQLPKDNTAEIADWLISSMFPDIDIFHIEAHTTKDGRSKGCAWVYVFHAEAAHELLSLHRSALFDIHPDTEELGVLVGTCEDLEPIAASFSKARAAHLPRQLLVAELPGAVVKPQKMTATPQPERIVADEKQRHLQQYKRPTRQVRPTVYSHNPYAFNPIPAEFQSITAIYC